MIVLYVLDYFNRNKQNSYAALKLLRRQGQIIDVKCKNRILIFFPAIIEVVREMLISNMHNKFEPNLSQ